jgi:hypothetical protein
MTTTKPTAAAMRAAKIIERHRLQYADFIAECIDGITGLPELLAVCREAIAAIESDAILDHKTRYGVLLELQGAVARAEGCR